MDDFERITKLLYENQDLFFMREECEILADYLTKNDVAPVKHGKWKLGKSGCMYFCSNCDLWVHPREAEAWEYCPNCGTRMDGDGS